MNKYAGKSPKIIPNRSIGYRKQDTISIGISQEIGKSAIYPDTAPAPVKFVKVIGGNLISSSIEAVQYSATISITQEYDPNVDTVYPIGLGNGKLYLDGIPQDGNCLIRHNFTGEQMAIQSGRCVAVLGTVSIPVSGSDPHVDLLAHTVYWL